MAQVCEVCGKRGTLGNQVTTRGRAKYLGGVGTKVTGISRRKFKVNLQNVRVSTPNGTSKSMRICAQCIRSGVVAKKVHVAPFKLPAGETAAAKPQAEKVPVAPKAQSVKSRKRQKGKEEKAAREKK